MKRKAIIIGIILALILVAVVWVSILAVQRGGISMIFTKPMESGVMKQSMEDIAVSGRELMAVVETKEEAEAIAKMYAITLVAYEEGVAEYTTDKPILGVIMEGKNNGYPKLSVNYRKEMAK